MGLSTTQAGADAEYRWRLKLAPIVKPDSCLNMSPLQVLMFIATWRREAAPSPYIFRAGFCTQCMNPMGSAVLCGFEGTEATECAAAD